ncbi:DNA-binding protein [Halorientalis salina]|uniref:DNA-binding protein n=1 Tax=Halorientalis salina TaxID=2932266 RepID=UPI0010ABCA02|nr:DNA-binding protein [Halorientalis salina]
MSGKTVFGNEGSDAQYAKQLDLDETDVEIVEDVVEAQYVLQPSVEQEIQAKVDQNHPDAQITGLTLEAEERLDAREMEIRRTRQRMDRHVDSTREQRTRRVARAGSIERRREFKKRAASVDPWAGPDIEDARAQLGREKLGMVNRKAARLAEELNGWSRAAISRRVAERVVSGVEIPTAVMGVFEDFQQSPGQVVPIRAVGGVDHHEVDLEGSVSVLWESTHPAIRQVGLLEDETGQIKFTSWAKSGKPVVREGDQVRFRAVAKSWYQGRCSVALTGRSLVTKLDGGKAE